jgi:hypothetical protein
MTVQRGTLALHVLEEIRTRSLALVVSVDTSAVQFVLEEALLLCYAQGSVSGDSGLESESRLKRSQVVSQARLRALELCDGSVGP